MHRNMPLILEEEHTSTPSEINYVGEACALMENISLSLERDTCRSLRTFVAPASSRSSDVTPYFNVTRSPDLKRNNDGAPFPLLLTRIQHETFPEGWKQRRSVGLKDVVRENGNILDEIKVPSLRWHSGGREGAATGHREIMMRLRRRWAT